MGRPTIYWHMRHIPNEINKGQYKIYYIIILNNILRTSSCIKTNNALLICSCDYFFMNKIAVAKFATSSMKVGWLAMIPYPHKFPPVVSVIK